MKYALAPIKFWAFRVLYIVCNSHRIMDMRGDKKQPRGRRYGHPFFVVLVIKGGQWMMGGGG